MKKKMVKWLARGLAIGWIIFLGVFSLDVFGEPLWLIALMMHLTPNIILAIALAVAWKHERWGGILFLAAGLIMAGLFKSALIGGPAVLIGGLFLLESMLK